MSSLNILSIVIATVHYIKNPLMKYLKASIFLLLSSLLFFTCTESSQKDVQNSALRKTGTQLVNFIADSSTDLKNIPGIYQGVFPCNDCDGMEQILFLKNNYTYKQVYLNVDSNKVFSTTNGEWKIQNNLIVLSKNNDYYVSFFPGEDSIYAVDIDGIKVQDPGLYALGRKEFGGSLDNWETEIKNGITFAGRGMDPGWILNIQNNIIYFKLRDAKKVLVAEKEAIERDEHSTTYHLTSNNKSWTVTIQDTFCKNGMSDAMYEYEVVVDYDGTQYLGCGTDLQ